MPRDQLRRLKRLEDRCGPAPADPLRALTTRLGMDEAEYQGAVQGHGRELKQHLERDGITWEGFRLLDELLRRERGLPARRSGEFG